MTIVIQIVIQITSRLSMIPVVLAARVPAATLTVIQSTLCVHLLPNENPCPRLYSVIEGRLKKS